MRQKNQILLLAIAVLFGGFVYIASCKHDDVIPPGSGGSGGSNIQRGEENVGLKDSKTTFDKVHSSVNWATAYLGELAVLTGKFNDFGMNDFNFEESNPDSIHFEGYVLLNSVNTGESARDDGCLLGTFGTTGGAGYEESNLAIIKSKSVEFSTTDKGYIVTADFTFHGVTKTIDAKMDYVGKTTSGDSDAFGFTLKFSILAKSDFGIESTSIADNVDISCSANFKRAP